MAVLHLGLLVIFRPFRYPAVRSGGYLVNDRRVQPQRSAVLHKIVENFPIHGGHIGYGAALPVVRECIFRADGGAGDRLTVVRRHTGMKECQRAGEHAFQLFVKGRILLVQAVVV